MKGKLFLGILLMLTFVGWVGYRVVADIQFDRGCEGHLKRAADANTVELAKLEIRAALNYIEAMGMTKGYTSIVYTTPDEDVEFWYNNIKASFSELENVSPTATQLEKSNLLIKLRETLLDSGENSVHVTVPEGISVFPSNTVVMLLGLLTGVAGAIGFFLVAVYYEESAF